MPMELVGLILVLAGTGAGYGLGAWQRRSERPSAVARLLAEREQQELKRLDQLAVRIDKLERCAKAHDMEAQTINGWMKGLEERVAANQNHTTALAKETLAMGTEIKGSLAALESQLDAQLNALSERQGELMETLEQQLAAMQAFIVQAADEAKARREAIAAPVAVPAVNELAQLMAQQRQAQEVFAARRRAQAEANFPGPGGAGPMGAGL